MNRNEVDEWVGESEITDLFIRELVEFNFLGEQFNDERILFYNNFYFEKIWDYTVYLSIDFEL